ncbi:MAG: response regulator [Spartobacteria bacterium]|nr:response regulator [Spartobacteria bacterium]
MKALVVEDDFVSRRLVQRLVAKFGDCDIAINGVEAIEAFETAQKSGTPYDLICLDIMMPKMNGHETLKKIREIEAQNGVTPGDGAKVIMVSALDDARNVMQSFKEQCEAYITKPVDTQKFLNKIREMGLIAKGS